MSHLRIKRKPRCEGCGLPPADCACAELPRIWIETPIAIVQHSRERYKPTNTGRLFIRMVENALLLPFGMREPAFDPSPLQDPAIEWRLLSPRGVTVPRPPEPGRRLGFVVLDGSWPQCSHALHRLPVVSQLPRVALPPGPPSFWSVRGQHLEEGRSTFEAALAMVEAREGPRPELRRAFATITARHLYLKGKLKSPEVPSHWVVV